MESSERIARRRKLFEQMDLILREVNYHRLNDTEEDLPGISVWTWDEEEGRSVRIT